MFTLTDQAFLLDILAEARTISELVEGFTYEQFLEDTRTRKAVERSFEILGLASKGMSKDFVQTHPELPWRWMVDTRNVIAHEYKKVNYALLWETIRIDIPDLIRMIEPLVPPDPDKK